MGTNSYLNNSQCSNSSMAENTSEQRPAVTAGKQQQQKQDRNKDRKEPQQNQPQHGTADYQQTKNSSSQLQATTAAADRAQRPHATESPGNRIPRQQHQQASAAEGSSRDYLATTSAAQKQLTNQRPKASRPRQSKHQGNPEPATTDPASGQIRTKPKQAEPRTAAAEHPHQILRNRKQQGQQCQKQTQVSCKTAGHSRKQQQQ